MEKVYEDDKMTIYADEFQFQTIYRTGKVVSLTRTREMEAKIKALIEKKHDRSKSTQRDQ